MLYYHIIIAITFFEFVASGTAVTEGDPGEVVSFDLCIRSSSVAATYSDTLDASVFGFGPNGGVPEAMLSEYKVGSCEWN